MKRVDFKGVSPVGQVATFFHNKPLNTADVRRQSMQKPDLFVSFGAEKRKQLSRDQAMSALIMHFMLHSTKNMMGRELDMTFNDLAKATLQHYRRESRGFQILNRSEIKAFERSISASALVNPMRQLADAGWFELGALGSAGIKGNNQSLKRVLRPIQPTDVSDLEMTVIQNLSDSHQIAVMARRGISQQDPGFHLGNRLPSRFPLVSPTPHTQASRTTTGAGYRRLARETGMIELRNLPTPSHSGHGLGWVVASLQPRAVEAQIRRSFLPVVHVLHHLTTTDGAFSPGQSVVGSRDLIQSTGFQSEALNRAKHRLVEEGWLRQMNTGNERSAFEVVRRPTDKQLTKFLAPLTKTTDVVIDDFLSRRHSVSEPSQPPTWLGLDQLIGGVQFPKDTQEGRKKSLVSVMAKALRNEALVPVLTISSADTSHHIRFQLNRHLNYEQLNAQINAVQRDPHLLLTALYHDTPSWRWPRVYQDQMTVVPTLVLGKQAGKDRLSYGAESWTAGAEALKGEASFERLVHMSKPSEDQRLQRHPQVFAERALGTLNHLYPLAQWDKLKSKESVAISAQERDLLQGLTPTLQTMGFRVRVAP